MLFNNKHISDFSITILFISVIPYFVPEFKLYLSQAYWSSLIIYSTTGVGQLNKKDHCSFVPFVKNA